MTDRPARYSQLAPLTIEQRKDLSLSAIRFFSPLQYRQMCAIIGKVPASERIEPLDGSDFLLYIEKTGQLRDPNRYLRQVNELLLQLSKAHILAEMGWGPNAWIGRRYYFMREFTDLEEQSIMWLAPALGAEFVLHMFAPAIVQITGVTGAGNVCAGTGLTIAPKWLLTCGHVLNDMKIDTKQSFAGRERRVVRTRVHDDVDIGLLEVTPAMECLQGLAFRDPVIAETVFTLGYPRIPMSRKPALVMHRGEITSSEVVTLCGQNLFLYSALARPGNSGGPVIALTGHVVGIVTEELYEQSDHLQMPFHAGVGTSEIVKAIRALEPSIRLPVEDYR